MDNFNSKIESFLILTTVSDQDLAGELCSALEQAKVPIMLEHVDIIEDGLSRVGYRLLAPSHYRETAMRILDLNTALHQTRNLVTQVPNPSSVESAYGGASPDDLFAEVLTKPEAKIRSANWRSRAKKSFLEM